MKKVWSNGFAAFWIGVLAVLTATLPVAAADHGSHSTPSPEGVALKVAPPASDIRQVPACPFCGMDREKFAHSRVFVEYDDGSVLGTCSIHCAAVDQSVKIDKTPVRIWVGDYKSRNLIDAEKAVWVMGGNKMGVMTKRAKWAFDSKESAEEFIKSEGGATSGFEQIMKASFEDMYDDTRMIRERRKAKRMGQKSMH